MNNIQIAAVCCLAFIVPVGAVFAMNYDKIVEEDLSSGRLLYFSAKG
jgi:hypothetical protein